MSRERALAKGHSLEEVVESGWAPSVLYLQRLLRKEEIGGYKIGRTWVMSDDDVESYLATKRNTHPQAGPTEVTRLGGLSSASARRRSA